MFQFYSSVIAMSFVGGVCANGPLWVILTKQLFGYPGHQVIKRRRLPEDRTSRGSVFLTLVGCMIGSCSAMIGGGQWLFLLPAVLSSIVAGLLISNNRVRLLGEQYLKRAHENVHAGDFAGAIQDANEAARCSTRYQDEACEVVTAAKELRKCNLASSDVRTASRAATGKLVERRQVRKRVM